MTALKNLGKLGADEVVAPVLVTVMDGDVEAMGRYQRFTQQLRNAGIRAEMYQGNWKKFGNQLKYADRRNCPIAIIQGGDERANGEVQIKDLIEGKRLSGEITDNTEWREARVAQIVVPEADLVARVAEILAAQAEDRPVRAEAAIHAPCRTQHPLIRPSGTFSPWGRRHGVADRAAAGRGRPGRQDRLPDDVPLPFFRGTKRQCWRNKAGPSFCPWRARDRAQDRAASAFSPAGRRCRQADEGASGAASSILPPPAHPPPCRYPHHLPERRIPPMPLINLPDFAPALAEDLAALKAERVDTPVIQPAAPFLDMAGEDLRRASS